MVRFASPKISAYQLREFIFELRPAAAEGKTSVIHELPVLYDGPDLKFILGKLSLSKKDFISLHAATDYLVYQVGFQPGFAFLGDTREELTIARRGSPRAKVPAGSVGLAGRQTGVYPTDGPGGWQLIGRCPWPMLRSGSNPTRLLAGDHVRFKPVSPAELAKLAKSPAPWPER
jgi:KipI family sensor histidine kinase inhibitor